MSDSDLLACPFCGSPPEKSDYVSIKPTLDETLLQPPYLRCSNGSCLLRYVPTGFSLEEWNTRHLAQPEAAEPCCGKYLTCQRPCTPRGRELEHQRLLEACLPVADQGAGGGGGGWHGDFPPTENGEEIVIHYSSDPVADQSSALEETFTLDELATACADCCVPDSTYESLALELSEGKRP